MPIRSIKSRRRGSKPLVFFKGTLGEAKGTTVEKLVEAFKVGGIDLSVQEAGRIKQNIIPAIENPQNQIVRVSTPAGGITLRVKRLKTGQIGLYQNPARHDIMTPKADPFDALKGILRKGFKTRGQGSNVFIQGEEKIDLAIKSHKTATRGDSYSLKLMAPFKPTYGNYGIVNEASPHQIAAINIKLAQDLAEKEIARRKNFYRLQIFKRFGIPVHFV